MYDDIPSYIEKFLEYMSGIKNRSNSTLKEYYYDLRNTFKYLYLIKSGTKDSKISKELIEETDIRNLDLDFFKSIELDDLHNYLSYLSKNLDKPTTRARKVAAIKSFFNYMTHKAKLLDKNHAVELETPKLPKRLPKYLNLNESLSLLHSVSGEFEKRDLCILTLFLNCGLRLSELVNINMYHIRDNILTVVGKGDKERSIYLNESCQKAIKEYIKVRPKDNLKDRDALFISKRGTRIGRRTVEVMVKKYIILAGLDPKKYSPHKLRHTAATLMHKYGNVDIRALQQVLGHESISTTEIYTHVDNEQVKDALEKNPLNNM